MNWKDSKTSELTEGFKEKGFLPEAFINLLALLGWNDGTEQEIFSKEELIEKFSIERVHSGGAKFDYEKAKWFNHEWIKRFEFSDLRFEVKSLLEEKGLTVTDDLLLDKVIALVKDRCTLLTDFVQQSSFFFKAPDNFDVDAVKPKWNEEKKKFFELLIDETKAIDNWESAFIEDAFKKLAAIQSIKAGEVLLPFRIMLVGSKFGPGVFDIVEVIGKDETIKRIQQALIVFG
jgi:glutamyl-tRNA synthetase